MTGEEKRMLQQEVGAIYHRESFGTVDGPGIRYVFFLQGCPLRCLYCHNVDSTSFMGGVRWTAGEAVEEILRYRGYITNGGATFSGGEPLAQGKFLVAMLKLLKEEGIHTVVDTSGCYTMDHPYVKEAVDTADLILLDIKSIDPTISRELSGMESDNAFALLDYCEVIGKPVWARQVLLRGYTLDEEQLITLAKKLATYTCIQRVELLPFHKLGEAKWNVVDRPYLLGDVEGTTEKELLWVKNIFAKQGIIAI